MNADWEVGRQRVGTAASQLKLNLVAAQLTIYDLLLFQLSAHEATPLNERRPSNTQQAVGQSGSVAGRQTGKIQAGSQIIICTFRRNFSAPKHLFWLVSATSLKTHFDINHMSVVDYVRTLLARSLPLPLPPPFSFSICLSVACCLC